MPSNIKNEKQYEALKDKGMSKERRQDRQLRGLVEPRRQEERVGRQLVAGWDLRPEEGGGPQGRQGRSEEVLGLFAQAT